MLFEEQFILLTNLLMYRCPSLQASGDHGNKLWLLWSPQQRGQVWNWNIRIWNQNNPKTDWHNRSQQRHYQGGCCVCACKRVHVKECVHSCGIATTLGCACGCCDVSHVTCRRWIHVTCMHVHVDAVMWHVHGPIWISIIDECTCHMCVHVRTCGYCVWASECGCWLYMRVCICIIMYNHVCECFVRVYAVLRQGLPCCWFQS